jgi:anti-sigma factor RsiW
MENIEAMLCAYVEGDLDAAGRAQIEKHLQDHPHHRKLLDELIAMRELVRGLPRAKAPMDVGDSLRQKVERSMLLDDTAVAAPSRKSVDRWPQFFGIAAIFLLVSALCFFVYKALGPTWKPAVFTQNTDQKVPDLGTADQTVAAAPSGRGGADIAAEAPRSDLADSNAAPAAGSAAVAMAPASVPAGVPAMAENSQSVLSQSLDREQALRVAQVDLQAIRRRLVSSGYGIHPASPSNSAPVLMVVDSTNVSATKAQITQFMSSTSGVSWNAIPAEAKADSFATTLPSADIAGKQGQNTQAAFDLISQEEMTKDMPSDLYVARGLTLERADALRQTLAIPQNGSQVQVTVQSAEGLATTEPSIETEKDVNVLGFKNETKSITTQPSDGLRTAGPMSATTAPSLAAQAANGAGAPVAGIEGLATAAKTPANLSPVDTVIVVQSAPVSTPTTQPVPETATPAAAATRP